MLVKQLGLVQYVLESTRRVGRLLGGWIKWKKV